MKHIFAEEAHVNTNPRSAPAGDHQLFLLVFAKITKKYLLLSD